MNINPAELRQTVEIFEKRKTAVDSAGFPVSENHTVRTCKAKTSRLSASEINRAEGDWTLEQIRFLVRYTSTQITRDMFVKWGQRVYEIMYINDYGDRHEYIEIVGTRTVKV